MAIDETNLDDGAGLVKQHEISGDTEKTTMRSAGDIKAIDQFLTDKEIGCNEGKRTNIMRNIFGFRAQRSRYQS
jgi:hypothetical protein